MSTVGILAYGSLIDDPGDEICKTINKRIDCRTPFPVEFARKSRNRCWAPTLVPYKGGGVVNAKILVVKLSICEAIDRLYRREINDTTRCTPYPVRPNPKPDHVEIKLLCNFRRVENVLYTVIGSNIHDLTAATLARLAVYSAQAKAGEKGRDGITYLIKSRKNGITTPLSDRYEAEIKRITRKASLKEARTWCRRHPHS